jgi:hypothetical protein
MFNTYPQIDEDATWEKFRNEYWEYLVDEGYSKEAIHQAIDDGDFWDWVDDFVPEDSLVYK